MVLVLLHKVQVITDRSTPPNSFHAGVDLCNDIIREEIQETGSEGESSKLPIPEEINDILNQYVNLQNPINPIGLGSGYSESSRVWY